MNYMIISWITSRMFMQWLFLLLTQVSYECFMLIKRTKCKWGLLSLIYICKDRITFISIDTQWIKSLLFYKSHYRYSYSVYLHRLRVYIFILKHVYINVVVILYVYFKQTRDVNWEFFYPENDTQYQTSLLFFDIGIT